MGYYVVLRRIILKVLKTRPARLISWISFFLYYRRYRKPDFPFFNVLKKLRRNNFFKDKKIKSQPAILRLLSWATKYTELDFSLFTKLPLPPLPVIQACIQEFILGWHNIEYPWKSYFRDPGGFRPHSPPPSTLLLSYTLDIYIKPTSCITETNWPMQQNLTFRVF